MVNEPRLAPGAETTNIASHQAVDETHDRGHDEQRQRQAEHEQPHEKDQQRVDRGEHVGLDVRIRVVDVVAKIPERLLIVFGSEKTGSSPEIEQAATLRVRIPIDERVESLNVSAAAGITLYNRIRFNQKGG